MLEMDLMAAAALVVMLVRVEEDGLVAVAVQDRQVHLALVLMDV